MTRRYEKSADAYEDAGPVKTQPSAKTMAFDPKTKKVFLVAVEYVETPATTPGGRVQRSVKPDSMNFNSNVIGCLKPVSATEAGATWLACLRCPIWRN